MAVIGRTVTRRYPRVVAAVAVQYHNESGASRAGQGGVYGRHHSTPCAHCSPHTHASPPQTPPGHARRTLPVGSASGPPPPSAAASQPQPPRQLTPRRTPPPTQRQPRPQAMPSDAHAAFTPAHAPHPRPRSTFLRARCAARGGACRYARAWAPCARVSDAAPSYRRSALLAAVVTDTLAAASGPAAPVVERAAKKLRAAPAPVPAVDTRYVVRAAAAGELYTVADIRCEAFYGSPRDAYYFPVRRREIYVAIRDRLHSGNRCLVVLDTRPPEEWAPFANEEGELVVGSLDVSLHGAATGRRCKFDGEAGGGESQRIYVSSMAVRGEWQRRGLAQRLLRHVDELAGAHRVQEMFLHVEWENAAAVHVYSKCGFVCAMPDEDRDLVPTWLHFLAKKEHTLMRKRFDS